MDSKTVGILGGGQLGRMIVEAAHRLNIKTVVLDGENSPAKQINALDLHVNGSFLDATLIALLAAKSDVLTVEIEHVNVDALEEVERTTGVKVYPVPETLKLIQDKYTQKEHLIKHGVAVAELVAVAGTSADDKAALLVAIGSKFGYPFMVKSRTLAYDGRGNYVVHSELEIPDAVAALGDRLLYAEKWCPFVKELAVMVVRALDGSVYAYPTVETVHQNNICHLVYAPARVSPSVREHASQLARTAVKLFPGCGIFGVEMFVLASGELLVNELAPRPHNSGHYTIDACVTLQFEAHVRAVAGLPLPAGFAQLSTASTNAIMLNVLGDATTPDGELEVCKRALETPGALVYLYGKTTRPGRKMGHINIVSLSMEECERKLLQIMGTASAAPEPAIASPLPAPLVGIIMGSDLDLPVMAAGADILKRFQVPFELTIVSAHRTPARMAEYAARAHERGLKAIIAGAGGAAHLPGMVAAMTPLPVIGVPVKGSTLDGVDSLHLIVQMPRGIPVATVAINNSTNAALLAVRILALCGVLDGKYMSEVLAYSQTMESEVLGKAQRLESIGYEQYLEGMKK